MSLCMRCGHHFARGRAIDQIGRSLDRDRVFGLIVVMRSSGTLPSGGSGNWIVHCEPSGHCFRIFRPPFELVANRQMCSGDLLIPSIIVDCSAPTVTLPIQL